MLSFKVFTVDGNQIFILLMKKDAPGSLKIKVMLYLSSLDQLKGTGIRHLVRYKVSVTPHSGERTIFSCNFMWFFLLLQEVDRGSGSRVKAGIILVLAVLRIRILIHVDPY